MSSGRRRRMVGEMRPVNLDDDVSFGSEQPDHKARTSPNEIDSTDVTTVGFGQCDDGDGNFVKVDKQLGEERCLDGAHLGPQLIDGPHHSSATAAI